MRISQYVVLLIYIERYYWEVVRIVWMPLSTDVLLSVSQVELTVVYVSRLVKLTDSERNRSRWIFSPRFSSALHFLYLCFLDFLTRLKKKTHRVSITDMLFAAVWLLIYICFKSTNVQRLSTQLNGRVEYVWRRYRDYWITLGKHWTGDSSEVGAGRERGGGGWGSSSVFHTPHHKTAETVFM